MEPELREHANAKEKEDERLQLLLGNGMRGEKWNVGVCVCFSEGGKGSVLRGR